MANECIYSYVKEKMIMSVKLIIGEHYFQTISLKNNNNKKSRREGEMVGRARRNCIINAWISSTI